MKKNKQRVNFFNDKLNIPYNFLWTKEKPISYITEAYQKFLINLEYVILIRNLK